MPDHPILYLGDTDLTGAACYLSGVMAHSGYAFDYVPSAQHVDAAMIESPRRLFILSDYPAVMMRPDIQQQLLQQVAQGAGLVMIGGWESFHGQDGHWERTPIASALPVRIAGVDDRINCDQPAMIVKRQDHPITDMLPWHDRPPIIGGFNRIQSKPDQTVALEVQQYTARYADNAIRFEPADRHPLLVTGSYDQGRTAALATDLAPHWVGPLVDWGPERITACAPDSCQIEVGNWYATFVRQLLTWVGRLDEP